MAYKDAGKTAYITGGASGIGLGVATMLAKRGLNIIIADTNLRGAQEAARQLTQEHGTKCAGLQVDVADWEQQKVAFRTVTDERRVDYVFPIAGIGEKAWTKFEEGDESNDYEEPNLVVLDVDLKGVLYTISLAVQHMRRQRPDDNGIRGKIISVASICGLYCVPTVPIYTAAKHGVVGFTRSYGAHLLAEGITLNAICPNVTKTAISTPEFYQKVVDAGVLVPMENIVVEFEKLLDDDSRSGECVEIEPDGTRVAPPLEPMTKGTKVSLDMIHERSRPLHAPTRGEKA